MLNLTFRDVNAVVSAMHAQVVRATIKSRFRYFQRLGFLEGNNNGPRKPSTFDLDGLLQVLVSFELSQAGLVPAQIIPMMRHNWPQLKKAMLLGWDAANVPTGINKREILITDLSAMTNAPLRASSLAEGALLLFPIPATEVASWVEEVTGLPRRLLIDPARLLISLQSALPKFTTSSLRDLEQAFDAYANQA